MARNFEKDDEKMDTEASLELISRNILTMKGGGIYTESCCCGAAAVLLLQQQQRGGGGGRV